MSCVALFLPHLVLLVCDAHRISLLLVRNVHTSCGKGCASVRVPDPPADWCAWVEVPVELFLLVQQLPLSLLVIILYVTVNFYTINSLFFIINQIFLNGCSQPSNGTPKTGFALDISTSVTLSGTSLTHNSGTTFRSWLSIGLTSVVNAIPVGEDADQAFDHSSLAEVQPSGPRRTHRFPVAAIFSHWFVCSGCKTCLFHFYLDQKQTCSRSSPFGLLIPEPSSLWQLEKSWIIAVGRQVCKHPIFFVLHCTLCYHRLLCGNHLLLNHRTVTKDDLSTNRLACRFLQLLNRQPEAYTRLLGGEISRSLPLSAISLTITCNCHRLPSRSVLIPNNLVSRHCLASLPLDQQIM